MANSPTLNLTMMAASQAQKEVVFNEFLIAMDALFKGVAISASVTTPPTTPADGDVYIIPSGMHGEWIGKQNYITFYYNGWQYVPPKDQMRMYDQAGSVWRVYHESAHSWDAEPASVVSVLNDLTNVRGTASDGQVLTYVGADGKWEPKPITFPSLALSALSNVSVTEDADHSGKGLMWNATSGKWEMHTFLSTAPGFLSLPDVHFPTGDGWVVTYDSNAGGTGIPGVKFVNPVDQVAVSSLSQIGDVAYPSGGPSHIPTGAQLVWSGAGWAPSSSTPTYAFENLIHGPGTFDGHSLKMMRVDLYETRIEYFTPSMTDLADVDVEEGTAIDGYVLAWNDAHKKWEAIAHASGLLEAMGDVNVTPGAGVNGYALTYDNVSGKWVASALAAVAKTGAYSDLSGKPSLATVATSGAYGDLTGKPTLFSGAWSDLTGKPSFATVATSGAYSDLTGKPALAAVALSGDYADLLHPPVLSLAALTDVQVTSIAGGQALLWNATAGKWQNGAVSTTLAALTDVNVTEGAGINGQYLKWDNATGKWVASAVVAGSFTIAGLSDVTVTEGAPIDGYVLYWKQADAKWEAKALPTYATVATSGAYSDLTGKPTLATVATTGSYNDLSGRPSIPGNSSFTLAGLGDCNTAGNSGTDGYVVYWDNATSKFKLKAASGSTTLAGDTDVAIASPSNGQVLTYNSATSKWVNAAQSVGATALTGLSDVAVSSPAKGQVLQYDTTTSKWVNKSSADLPAYNVGNVSGALAIDRANGETQILTVTGNITGITITNWGGTNTLSKLTLVITNTGAFTVALPAAKWAGGVAPTVSSGAKTDILTFLTLDSGATLYGNVVGQNFA